GVALTVDGVLAHDLAALSRQRQRAANFSLTDGVGVKTNLRMAPRLQDLLHDRLFNRRLVARAERNGAARAGHHAQRIGVEAGVDLFALDRDAEPADQELQVMAERREHAVL